MAELCQQFHVPHEDIEAAAMGEIVECPAHVRCGSAVLHAGEGYIVRAGSCIMDRFFCMVVPDDNPGS